MLGKIFLVVYVLVQILISVLTEYSVRNSRVFKNIGEKTKIIRIIIYAALAAVPVLGAYLPKSGFKFFCMEAGNIWLGFFMFYSVFVLILFPIIKAVIKNKKKGDNSLIGKAFQFAFLGAFAIMAAGLIHAQQPKLVNYDVELANASAKGEKVKIVLLADLHLSVNAVLSAAIFFSKKNTSPRQTRGCSFYGHSPYNPRVTRATCKSVCQPRVLSVTSSFS